MNTLQQLSISIMELTQQASAKIFHVPSPIGGRSALGFDGKRLLVHALEASENEELEILAPGSRPVKAKVVGFSQSKNLAVLQLDTPMPETAWQLNTSTPPLGSMVVTVAFASPQGPEVRLDLVRFVSNVAEDQYFQLDGNPFPGFAGSAIVEPGGSIVGYNMHNERGNRGWAITAGQANSLIDEICEHGFSGVAWLGVVTSVVSAPRGSVFGDNREFAQLVTAVARDSPAERAGIMVGDLIASIAARPIKTPADFRQAIASLHPGKEAAIELIRGGAKKAITIVPSSRSGNC